MALQEALKAHLETGLTTVARAWSITRTDGSVYGFTDHDRDLVFEGVTFKADSGLTASALDQATGLAVDNTEALGVLSDLGVREDDILAGRFDCAQVMSWLVNWANPEERSVLFRGTIGEILRAGGAFRAELRGLTEALNRPMGRVYQKPCTAALGDANCGFDLTSAGYAADRSVGLVEGNRVFQWSDLADFEPGWFARGRLIVTSGSAQGLSGNIKSDTIDAEGRRIVELWEPLGAPVEQGDDLRLEAGCDRRMETCRLKFGNLLNFRGFPDIPGEDWLTSHPNQGGVFDGGSRR